MIRISETTRALPFFRPIRLTDLPLIYHPEHLFPYASYGETATEAVPRIFRMVVLENEFLRVEVAPELGGRVYSLFDKRIGKEVLFSNPVVKPVRILPVWAFISGGIEFNFPIAHSPTSIAEVGCKASQSGRYGFIRVGEREARTGMEWVVELGLVEGKAVLVQRTGLRNFTTADHPWMMWTIAACPSRESTEFIHPPHRVLVHDQRLAELDWPGEGLNWDRNFREMTALFWKPGSAPYFGVFDHSAGCGLLHWAEPGALPGKKVWTYGHGADRAWGEATTEGGLSYVEIESGPLLDQSEKPLFPRGTERMFEEYWIPVDSREAFDFAWPRGFEGGSGTRREILDLELPPLTEPWLGWGHSPWQCEWELFRAGAGPLPKSAVPTGIELEGPLRDAMEQGNGGAVEPLALWLAFHGRPEEALDLVRSSAAETAQRLAGLILWKGLSRADEAVVHLERGPLNDPVAVVELDQLYAELQRTEKRGPLLKGAPMHRMVIERLGDLALSSGRPEEALRLLQSTPWPREHQRYVRSELWRRAKEALGEAPGEPPRFLNEDKLARFGAYWSEMKGE